VPSAGVCVTVEEVVVEQPARPSEARKSTAAAPVEERVHVNIGCGVRASAPLPLSEQVRIRAPLLADRGRRAVAGDDDAPVVVVEEPLADRADDVGQ